MCRKLIFGEFEVQVETQMPSVKAVRSRRMLFGARHSQRARRPRQWEAFVHWVWIIEWLGDQDQAEASTINSTIRSLCQAIIRQAIIRTVTRRVRRRHDADCLWGSIFVFNSADEVLRATIANREILQNAPIRRQWARARLAIRRDALAQD